MEILMRRQRRPAPEWCQENRVPRRLRIKPDKPSVTNRIDPAGALMANISGRIFNQEVAMIKKAEGGYKVLSEKGKNLGGPYKTKKEAAKRLQQVEYFKHKKG
jgi:hypothetical protein